MEDSSELTEDARSNRSLTPDGSDTGLLQGWTFDFLRVSGIFCFWCAVSPREANFLGPRAPLFPQDLIQKKIEGNRGGKGAERPHKSAPKVEMRAGRAFKIKIPQKSFTRDLP